MPTSTSAPVRIALFGHVSATPAALTKALGEQGIYIEATTEDIAHVDCAIFAVNPSAGIDAETIAAWESATGANQGAPSGRAIVDPSGCRLLSQPFPAAIHRGAKARNTLGSQGRSRSNNAGMAAASTSRGCNRAPHW